MTLSESHKWIPQILAKSSLYEEIKFTEFIMPFNDINDEKYEPIHYQETPDPPFKKYIPMQNNVVL